MSIMDLDLNGQQAKNKKNSIKLLTKQLKNEKKYPLDYNNYFVSIY
jgi:hypothetical protein